MWLFLKHSFGEETLKSMTMVCLNKFESFIYKNQFIQCQHCFPGKESQLEFVISCTEWLKVTKDIITLKCSCFSMSVPYALKWGLASNQGTVNPYRIQNVQKTSIPK